MKTKKISPKSLEAAVDRYFASIRRTVVATERVETGPRTFEERPILSDTGEPIRCREYVVAPTVWGLCESLGITPAQWKSLCDREEHPELQDAVQRAAGLMRDWREQALLTKKDVRGLIYHMQNRLGGLDELPLGEPEPLSLSEKGRLLEETEDDERD